MGLPGSGKTTAAQIICQLTGAVHIWADRERQRMFGRPTHTPLESQKLYDYLNNQTRELLSSGHDVVFDTNFNFHKDRLHLKTIADSCGASTKVIQMTTPAETARQRALDTAQAKRNGMPGQMTVATFDRIATHLEPLSEKIEVIMLSGEHLNEIEVSRAIGQA